MVAPVRVAVDSGGQVRNIFDQYHGLENRLTHAFTHVLERDQRLTREFLRFALRVNPPEGPLRISCQFLPGEVSRRPLSDEEVERRSLPDFWIWTGTGEWAVAGECKVTAGLGIDQLRRHAATARRLGFHRPHLLMITGRGARPVWATESLGVPMSWLAWSRLFQFLSDRANGQLISDFLEYMRIAEDQLMAEGYEGAPLTTFTGIPFGPEQPYSEPQARVILRALMAALRPKLARISGLRVDPAIGRPVLGGGWEHAWDIVGFSFARGVETFTEAPHLTVAVGRTEAAMQLTVPHGAHTSYWARLQQAGAAVLRDRLSSVTRLIRPIRRHVGAEAWEPQLSLQLYQRHFYAQRRPTLDGFVRFEVDALFATKRKLNPRVKTVPSWLDAFVLVLLHARQANFEFALRADFPLRDGSVARRPEFVDTLVSVARAFQPFVSLIAGTPSPVRPHSQSSKKGR